MRRPVTDLLLTMEGWESKGNMMSKTCTMPDCDKPSFGHGYCNAHYTRWRKHGDASAGGRSPGWAREYFEKTVIPYSGDDCLIWPYAKNKAGYGKLGVAGKFPHVHRLACERIHGTPPTPAHEASHKCGNGNLGCCNPLHLEWKTPKNNQADRRDHGTDGRGERNAGAKLTATQVLEVRSLRGQLSEAEIAARFGVSRGCISGILLRRKWGWLDGPADLDAA